MKGPVEEALGALPAEPEELVDIRALRRGTFTGRPVAEPDFVRNSVVH